MIQLFADSKAIAGTQMRVLLAAHTNRAVDNVLSRLLSLGFTGEFVCAGPDCALQVADMYELKKRRTCLDHADRLLTCSAKSHLPPYCLHKSIQRSDTL